MSVRSGLFVVLTVGLFFAYASSAHPQGSTAVAQLNGTVLDESGGGVKGATLTLRQTDTNRSYTTTSNDSGYYAVVNLPPGQYELTTAFKGFVQLFAKASSCRLASQPRTCAAIPPAAPDHARTRLARSKVRRFQGAPSFAVKSTTRVSGEAFAAQCTAATNESQQ
jgi:Carboxypeptidase regulatory-like domain